MSISQIFTEYVLVYCVARGLSSIGEPLPSKSRSGPNLTQSPNGASDKTDLMPVWITSLFVFLYAANYTVSLMVWYVYNVVCTVIIVASSKVSFKGAAMAEGQEDSQRVRLERLVLQLRTINKFKQAGRGMRRVRTGSVTQTREELRKLEEKRQNNELAGNFKLKRRTTLLETHLTPFRESPILALWQRFTMLPCFRGFVGSLYMVVPRWYLSFVIDWLLSGQPKDYKLGYGTTSLVLTTYFGGGFAVWTHYCITKPSNKNILKHFPRGREVLTELLPITGLWAVCEHLPSSLSLALSRLWDLKPYAIDATNWNTLDQTGRMVKLGQFSQVLLTYGLLTAIFSVPATMMLRRVYASMLSDEDLAIVPFHRGEKRSTHNYEERSELHKPGLSYSQAWNSIKFSEYLRVLGFYIQYFLINQLLHLAYWSLNWKLQEIFKVDQYAQTKLPWSPIGVIKPLETTNSTLGFEYILHSEL